MNYEIDSFPIMSLDEMPHDITCVCAKCNDPKPFRFFTGGVIRADKITASTINAGQIKSTHPAKPRTFIWLRQSSVDLAPRDKMDGPATYDNGGRYVALETVLDLEYTIIDTEDENRNVKTVPLSLEDAKSYCDTWNAPAFSPDYSIIVNPPKQDHSWIWDQVERKVCSLIYLVISFFFLYLLNNAFDWGLF